MVENERTKLNVERRKKKATHYQAYEEEEIDEFGQIKRKEILDKYNEGMDGENKKKETFRLGFFKKIFWDNFWFRWLEGGEGVLRRFLDNF